jgi:hypothetical protein
LRAKKAKLPWGRRRSRSAGGDKIDGLWSFSLLVGLDIEGNSLSFVKRLEAGLLDGRDMHENVAAAVIRLDKAIAALGIEKLDGTCHGHWETPFPMGCAAAARAAARPTCTAGIAAAPPEAERQSQRPQQ